jgi:large conductance mechanosensitive channel
MGMISAFKDFAMRGNVVDLAVAVVIGGAFGKIVTSLVGDVIMPPIGIALGGVDFTNLQLTLKDAVVNAEGVEEVAAVAIRYGAFVQTIVDFLIVAWAIFMVVRAMNSMKKKEEAAPAPPPQPSEEVLLLREIRDNLKR